MKEKFLLSTIADDAPETAAEYGLGIELADFCTAYNMDKPYFDNTCPAARTKLRAAARHVFHAPFNELYPAAIEPRAVSMAYDRLTQAAFLSIELGIRKMVVHSGYVPMIYFKSWHHERSVIFWRELMSRLPDDFFINIENVMDDTPDMIPAIVGELADPRVGVCLDVGHANVVSDAPLSEWVDAAAPFLRHVHLHNNYGEADLHNCPQDGNIDLCEIIRQISARAPEATMTFETQQARPAAEWLSANGFI